MPSLPATEAMLTMRPYPFVEHEGHDRAAAIEHAVEIDVDHPLPAVDGKFMHRRGGTGDAGGSDQDIDFAQRLALSFAAAATASGSVDVERDDVRRAGPHLLRARGPLR